MPPPKALPLPLPVKVLVRNSQRAGVVDAAAVDA